MILKKQLQSLKFVIALALLCRVSVALAQGGATEEAKGYAGKDACLECHKEKAVTGPHAAKAHEEAFNSQNSCETCHGPALQHAKYQEDASDSSLDPTLPSLRIGSKSTLPVEQRNAACTQCHTGNRQALWEGSEHQLRDVGCTDCHNSHTKNPKYLNSPTEMEVCATCHKDVKAQLQRSSHHPIREGKMQCSDCHNSHGTISDKLVDATSVNDKCFECHAEKRGPFLWDHAPASENCLNCHTSHGSSHDSLLVQKVPYLCQSCHSEARHPGTLYAIPTTSDNKNAFVMLNNRAFNRACMNCHVSVHGSNSPSGQSLAR